MGTILPFPGSGDTRNASMSSAVPPLAATTGFAEAEDSLQWGAWMAQAQRGDRAAYHALLNSVTPYLRAIARRYLRQEQDAEDMVQEILIVVHDIRHTYEPGRPFKPWLGTIATRRCIDSLRRRMRRNLHEIADEELLAQAPDQSQGASPESRLEREQEDREVRRAVQTLPKRQREALQLLRIEELSLNEAAAASAQSVGSLKVACHRAIRALQAAMVGKEQDHE
ncbi:MAG: sigma-70 family RNA polymerase sigma factor [Arenimonas sp.]